MNSENSGYETRDVDVKAVTLIGLFTFLGLMIILTGVAQWINSVQSIKQPAQAIRPLVHSPRLQPNPTADYENYVRTEEIQADSARVSIDEAIDKVVIHTKDGP